MFIPALQELQKQSTDGTWFSVMDGAVGICVRPSGSAEYQREIARLVKAAKIKNQSQLTPEILTELHAKAASKTMLSDWKVTDESGAPIPFSPKAAYEAFMTYPDFRVKVEAAAKQLEERTAAVEEEEEKNSVPS